MLYKLFSIFNKKGKKYEYRSISILNVIKSISKKGLYKILELAECLKNNNDFHFYLIGNQISLLWQRHKPIS